MKKTYLYALFLWKLINSYQNFIKGKSIYIFIYIFSIKYIFIFSL
jgi:hypothetical protein